MCDNLTAIGYHYDGGFAEYMVIPSLAIKNDCVNIVPDNLTFEEAALTEPIRNALFQELMAQHLNKTNLHYLCFLKERF